MSTSRGTVLHTRRARRLGSGASEPGDSGGAIDVPPASGGGSWSGPSEVGHAIATEAIATSTTTVISIDRLRVPVVMGDIGASGYRGDLASPVRTGCLNRAP